MASTGGSLYMSSSSFTDHQLLANNKQEVQEGGFGGRVNYDHQHKKNIEIPNYKSFLQSSLPILSPTPFSPSSYLSFPSSLMSPNFHLDSPHMLFNSSDVDPFKKQETEGSFIKQVEFSMINPGGLKSEPAPLNGYSDDRQQVSTAVEPSHYHHQPPPPSQYMRDQKKSDDGFNWRKYGQKQAKGSENPRSYYKCTFPNCPTKKKVERNPHGHVTEIVYKGSHNHPKPQPTRRSSSSSSSNLGPQNPEYRNSFGLQNQSISFLEQAPKNSSASFGDEDVEHGFSSDSRDDYDEINVEREAKRWKGDNENEGISSAPGSQMVREPKVVIQTTSEIDILDDGYRWRKYGQKVVKGNPNPRSYYKCTSNGCPVRKHVERACNDLRAVITTYEGKHNHNVPAARGSGSYVMNRQPPITSTPIRPAASVVNNHSSETNYTNTKMQSQRTLPYTLQMINGSTNNSFGFSGQGNSSGSFRVDDHMAHVISKEEPRDYDSFCESFMN